MIRARRVRLEFDQLGEPARGTYGRLLTYVFVDGENLNLELIRLGFSPHYVKYGRHRLADSFDQAEREARTAGRGIHSNH